MRVWTRLSQVFAATAQIPFDDSSRIVLMSDCHRGDGSWADDFAKNQHLSFAALNYYYHENYTYIEIGDGDELWEHNKFADIKQVHSDIFWLLAQFFAAGRFYMIYGNHDRAKQDTTYVRKNLSTYYDERTKKHLPLFPQIKVHEGLILRHRVTGDKIFLVHGHQGEWLNDRMWRLARFLSAYLWRPLELLGVNDPTSIVKNYSRQNAAERRLVEWARRKKQMLITGHTHRPVFPEVGEVPYFNDGSSVHPRCITGIEIRDGYIMLVKWNVQTRADATLFVGRDILAGPRKLTDYFNSFRTFSQK